MSETIRAYCWGCGKTDAWWPVTATAPDGSTYPAYASECGRIIEDASLLRWRVESQKRKQAAKNRRCGLFGRVVAWLTGPGGKLDSRPNLGRKRGMYKNGQ